MDKENPPKELTQPFPMPSSLNKSLLVVVVAALSLGVLSGLILSKKATVTKSTTPSVIKSAQQDTKTFRDFTQGIIRSKPLPSDPTEYTEGTHLLEREGVPPVALTSSVVDLSKYEGKKVKVFGETQKAIKEGWLMDVGRVEEIR